MLEGIGDDGHLERVERGVAYRQRHAVDGDAALIYGEVSPACHCLVEVVFESEILAAIGVGDLRANGSLIDMSLHYMSVEPSVHDHRPLHVHLVARLEQSEVTSVEGFLHGGHHIFVAFNLHYGEAYAVVGYALVYLQLAYKRACEREVDIVSVVRHGSDGCKFFNYSRKHDCRCLYI